MKSLLNSKKGDVWDYLGDIVFWLVMLAVILVIVYLIFKGQIDPMLQRFFNLVRFS